MQIFISWILDLGTDRSVVFQQDQSILAAATNVLRNMCVRRPTGSLDESRVGVVCDKRDGQLSEVELQRTRDNVDVLISAGRDVGLLAVWSGWRECEGHEARSGQERLCSKTC